MAGLIARLLGGKPQNGPADPVQGIGGYTDGEGPYGATGFPGSTAQVRTFPGPVTDTGINNQLSNELSGHGQERQASYRGDVPGAKTRNPRLTSSVSTPQPAETAELQNNSPAEFYGGPMLRTRPGLNDTAGGYINRSGATAMGLQMADSRDTMTPWVQAQPVIGENTPGSENVRNQVAQRYKAVPGQVHTYKSSARPDQAPVNPGGQATDGNVHPERVVQEVSVPSRTLIFGTGNQTWSVQREMPYGGRGDGARGADLNGQRYYATGQERQFLSAGQGEFGINRKLGGGHKSPVGFSEPAPWTSQFYTTTDDIGTNESPNQNPGQVASNVYISPSSGRASNGTGRTA